MKNTGFITPKIDKTAYVLGQGNVPFKVLKEDGDWRSDKHIKEYQSKSFLETYNCTSFGILNQIEQYLLVAFGELHNYSDRWVGIIAETKPPGNDPHIVYEAIRKYGLIPEEMLPFSDNIENVKEYYSFKGADKKACYEEGERWLKKYKLFHEWVFDANAPLGEKIHNMKLSLKYSTLTLGVDAWRQDNRGVYIRLGDDTHWTCMGAFTNFEKIFDSYDPVEKDVEQEIFWCKRIHIDKLPEEITTQKKITFWQKLIAILFREKLIYRAFKIFNIEYNQEK